MYICTYSETVTESEKRVLKVGHEGTWRYKATISETKWHNDKCCTDPTVSWTFVFGLKEFGVCKTWATYLALCEKMLREVRLIFKIWESSACWNAYLRPPQAGWKTCPAEENRMCRTWFFSEAFEKFDMQNLSHGMFFFLVGDPMKQWFWQRTLELYNWCTVGSIPPFLGGYVLCHLSDSRHAQQQGRFRRNHKAGLSNRARQVKFFTHACSSARQWNWSDSILFSLCRCSDWSVSFATVSLLSFSFFVNHYYLSPKQKFHRHVRTFFKVWLRV